MGNIFKELREKNNLSQAEISRRTGISQQTISYMEVSGGHTGSDNLLKIANFYDVTTDFLLGVGKSLEEEDEIFKLYNKMTTEERQNFIKFGKYLIASRHQ